MVQMRYKVLLYGYNGCKVVELDHLTQWVGSHKLWFHSQKEAVYLENGIDEMTLAKSIALLLLWLLSDDEKAALFLDNDSTLSTH